jgi:hypothetical protein
LVPAAPATRQAAANEETANREDGPAIVARHASQDPDGRVNVQCVDGKVHTPDVDTT